MSAKKDFISFPNYICYFSHFNVKYIQEDKYVLKI